MQTIGTCSKCGGPVQVPEFWGGSVPPRPTCTHCGATAANSYGQVIPMVGGRDDGIERLGEMIRKLAQGQAHNVEGERGRACATSARPQCSTAREDK
jgi:hypothetical protein